MLCLDMHPPLPKVYPTPTPLDMALGLADLKVPIPSVVSYVLLDCAPLPNLPNQHPYPYSLARSWGWQTSR